MSDPSINGIHLTREYYKDFIPTDLQWDVSEIDKNFTLYDLFRLVYAANTMIPGIPATMGMSNFDEFWQQICKDRDDNDTDEIEYLELYWHIGYGIRKTTKTGKPTDQKKILGLSDLFDQNINVWDDPKVGELSNLMSFHGVGMGCPHRHADWHECGDDCPPDTGYAIEFTPVNNLAHLPIRVSPTIDFYPPHVECDRDFHRTGFELTINPTLWCFITSIFWELTFEGSTPDKIEKQRDIVQERLDKAKEHLDTVDEDDIDER